MRLCAGKNYSILNRNYRMNLEKIKEVLLSEMKFKFEGLMYYYEDELTFLLDCMEHLLNMDYNINDSLYAIINRS